MTRPPPTSAPRHPPPPPHQPPLQPPHQPPHQQPLQPPPPYYYHPRSKPPTGSSCTSCLLATIFLAVLAVAGAIACYILFRPQSPIIAVNSMKFPSFSLLNNTANFTFFQYVAVRNPNRYDFSHYDSSLQLFSSATGPVGFVYIPAGKIAGGRTQYMSATFDVKSFPVPAVPVTATTTAAVAGMGGGGGGATMELESRMKLVGTVKVMKVFAHHVEKGATCRVTIQVSDGSVLGYNC